MCSCMSFNLAVLRDLGATSGLERLGCEDDLCTFSGKPEISKQKRPALPTVSGTQQTLRTRAFAVEFSLFQNLRVSFIPQQRSNF